MFPTLLRVHAINLRRDRVGQLRRFRLPVAFFTVFALVFGGAGRGDVRPLDVLVVNTDGGRAASRVYRALAAETGLRVRTTMRLSPGTADTTRVPLDRARAEAMVRDGDAPVAVVLPAGLDSALASPDGAPATIELLTDPANPFAASMVGGLLQKATMTALPDAMLHRGAVAFDQFGGGLTDAQREAVARWTSDMQAADPAVGTPVGASISSPIEVVTREVVGEK